MNNNFFSITKNLTKTYPDMDFGYAIVYNVEPNQVKLNLKKQKVEALTFIKNNTENIIRKIKHYELFFKNRKYKFPLLSQFKMIQKKGFPTISPYIDRLLISELSQGILMGVQDLDKINENLQLDLGKEGENFLGMRQKITCLENEIVLRDQTGIIASYFQGPDQKTQITEITTNIIIFAFYAPGINSEQIKLALECYINIFIDNGNEIEVISSTREKNG